MAVAKRLEARQIRLLTSATATRMLLQQRGLRLARLFIQQSNNSEVVASAKMHIAKLAFKGNKEAIELFEKEFTSPKVAVRQSALKILSYVAIGTKMKESIPWIERGLKDKNADCRIIALNTLADYIKFKQDGNAIEALPGLTYAFQNLRKLIGPYRSIMSYMRPIAEAFTVFALRGVKDVRPMLELIVKEDYGDGSKIIAREGLQALDKK
jgi:hypothetical protein